MYKPSILKHPYFRRYIRHFSDDGNNKGNYLNIVLSKLLTAYFHPLSNGANFFKVHVYRSTSDAKSIV